MFRPADRPGRSHRAANAILAPHQRIAGFTLWPEPDFPRTHTLKIKRHDVLAQVINRSDNVSKPRPLAPDWSSPYLAARRLIMEATGTTTTTPELNDTLGDVGLDSLARVELLAVIETEVGVYLDESKVDATTSVRELEQMVETGQGAERPVFPAWPRSRVARAARIALQGRGVCTARAVRADDRQGY